MQQALLLIGVGKDAVVEARKTIMTIMETTADQETKRKALDTLTALCQTNNTTVTNCNFGILPKTKK